MTPSHFFCFVASMLVFSCATTPETKKSVDASTNTIEKKGLAKFEGGYSIEQDPETGFARAKSHKDELYKDAKSKYLQTANVRKKFNTDAFDSRRWQGTKSKEKKQWEQKKVYAYSPEFVRRNAKYATQAANEADDDYREGSDVYNTYLSREQSAQRQSNELDYKVQHRRDVSVAPKIVESAATNPSGRTVEDVKGLLND